MNLLQHNEWFLSVYMLSIFDSTTIIHVLSIQNLTLYVMIKFFHNKTSLRDESSHLTGTVNLTYSIKIIHKCK